MTLKDHFIWLLMPFIMLFEALKPLLELMISVVFVPYYCGLLIWAFLREITKRRRNHDD